MKFSEFFQDVNGYSSAARLCFIFGTFGLFALATAQFCGYGELPTTLYIVLATMASGGYIGGKYLDKQEMVDIEDDDTQTPA